MGRTRNRYCGILPAQNCGYLVAYSLQWEVLASERVDTAAGALVAMTRFMRRFEADGWTAESDGAYGFLFMHREGQRILLTATPRNPLDESLQSFSPFQSPDSEKEGDDESNETSQ